MHITKIKEQLDAIERDLVARVPEHLFINHILPLIAGDEGHNSLEVWNHLAGSIFNRMSVVDASGAVLFTLPAIAATPTTPLERDGRNSLFEIMQGYEARTKLSPIYARNFFDNALQDKIVVSDRDVETLLLVDEILVKYGRKPHLPPGYGKSQAVDTDVIDDPVGEIGDAL